MGEIDLDEASDMFQTLADETRLQILLAIARHQGQRGPLPYGEIMDDLDIEDSGRFNYHLNRLQDHFIRQEADNYVPTAGAHELLWLLRSEKMSDETMVAPETVGASCLRCGSALETIYDDDLYVSCHDCGESRMKHPTSPSVARSQPLRTLAAEADRRHRRNVAAMFEGSCLLCGGETEFEIMATEQLHYDRCLADVLCYTACRNCNYRFGMLTIGQLVLCHPTVRTYCHEHGIDLFERPQWEYTWTRSDRSTEIRSRDPWRYRKYGFVDGCRLVVQLEGSRVTHVDHVSLR